MKVNHVIRTLIVSDFLINSGFSVFAPIFAVFITKQITGGTVAVVGFAAGIAQIFKVGLQIPIARYLDKNHGEYDDFISLLLGAVLVAVVPFLYYFASTTLHIFIIQAVYGCGLALVVPPWYAIFTRHIDHMKENVEWSLESVAIGISGALFAALGGLLAEHVGFKYLFVMGGIFSTIGSITLLFIFNDLRAKVARGVVEPHPDRI